MCLFAKKTNNTKQNNDAASQVLDEAYFAATGILPANNWNYIHNMAYAVANFIEAGRREEALAAGTVLMNLDIPKPDDPRNLQLLQPVQFSPDTSRAGGRFFYQVRHQVERCHSQRLLDQAFFT